MQSSSSFDDDEEEFGKSDDFSSDSAEEEGRCQSTAPMSSAVPSPLLNDRPSGCDQNSSSSSAGGSQKISSSSAAAATSINDPFDIANFKLEYTDLNECVSALLKKAKDENIAGRDIKRRQRKNKDQLKQLENEFLKNPDWSREFIRRISQRLQLRECQVYKWHWDQRKKEGLSVDNYSEV